MKSLRSRVPVFLFLLAFSLLFSISEAFAEERILRYTSVAWVNPDASMKVRENILFNVEGKDIKRGIIRVFPVNYKTDTGRSHRTGFDLVSVKLDGQDIPSTTSYVGDNVEIKIGDPDKMLAHGQRTFDIVYKVTGHIRDLKDRDALYWNVTGNDWAFPIDSAGFRLFLPEGAKIMADNAYTGLRGESGRDFMKTEKGSFITTRPLPLHAGFTVAVDWEKGLVTYPEPERTYFSDEQRGSVIAGIPLLALLYFALAWFFFGRDPKMGTIVPQWDPPAGMTPGYMAMLRDRAMKVIPACFTADVLELAVRGYLRLAGKGKKDLSLECTSPDAPGGVLGEIMTSLFAGGRQVINSGLDKLWLSSAWEKMKEVYENKRGADHWWSSLFALVSKKHKNRSNPLNRMNSVASALTALLLLLSVGGLLCLIPGPLDSDAQPLGILSGACLGIGLSWPGLTNLRGLFPGRRSVRASFVKRIMMFFKGVCFSGFGLTTLRVALQEDPSLAGALILATLIVFWFSVYLMPVKSAEAVRQLAQVEGLAMYIRAAERDRLAALNAPEDSPEIFEKLLPYAVALDCADAWCKRFGPLLEQMDYSPGWCADDDRNALDNLRNGEILAGLAGAARIASSYVAPSGGGDGDSWSGGSGTDGGSSGGGSGGGGGHGW
jgi:hypothetical protein